MGHTISAVIARASASSDRAKAFDVPIITLPQGFVLLPLDPDHLDHWGEQLGIGGFLSERPLLNCRIVHHLAGEILGDVPFAVIETDYCGGSGDQAAVVYAAGEVLIPPAVGTRGPISNALKRLGACRDRRVDEFAALDLGRYRTFEESYVRYHDP